MPIGVNIHSRCPTSITCHIVPPTSHGHDLVTSLHLPREEGGDPLHQLLRGEAKDGTVGKDGQEHHHTHYLIPDTNMLAPVAGKQAKIQ